MLGKKSEAFFGLVLARPKSEPKQKVDDSEVIEGL